MFPIGKEDLKALFIWSWKVLSTRAFQVNNTSIIPFADKLNHG